jgi:hypothetical protein
MVFANREREVHFVVLPNEFRLTLLRGLILAPWSKRKGKVDSFEVGFQIHEIALHQTYFISTHETEDVPTRCGMDVRLGETVIMLWILFFLPVRGK